MKVNLRFLESIFVIILAAIAVIASIFTIEKYFAKTDEVILIEERLEIGIMDDRVFQQEQQIVRLKNLTEFERREVKKTDAEKEIINKEEGRLRELKDRREKKIEQYEERRK